MPAFAPEDLARWSQGQWSRVPSAAVTGFSIDTRTLQPGDCFAAIRGEKTDGHRFLDQAFRAGAAAAIVSQPQAAGGPLLRVADAAGALRRIAGAYRRTLDLRVIGITGSVGKTTVKEMLACLLAAIGPTAKTQGNWNNDLGVPLSLLRARPGDAFGVFEIGMNHPGELAPLCELLRPQWGVMGRIGPVHLAHFASVRAIAEEKAVLFGALPPEGGAVISLDDEWSGLLRRRATCRVVTTSMLSGDADYVGRMPGPDSTDVEVRHASSGDVVRFALPIPGEFMLQNALLALATARELGLPLTAAPAALRRLALPPLRWQRETVGGVQVINDSYNANPVSMRAALQAFAALRGTGGKWVVLGGMRELGAAEDREHVELGRAVAAGPWTGLVVVGRLARRIADGAEEGGLDPSMIFRCSTHAEAAGVLKQRAGAGDAVLLKASRGEALEKVLEHWSNQPPEGH